MKSNGMEKEMEGLGAGEIIFSGGQCAFAVWLGYDNRSLLSMEFCGSRRQEMKDRTIKWYISGHFILY